MAEPNAVPETLCELCHNPIRQGKGGVWYHVDGNPRHPAIPAKLPDAPPEDKYPAQKHCCTVCAQKRRCSVCDESTTTACSDCAIDLTATVYVCSKRECQDEHARKCPHELQTKLAAAQPDGWIAVTERLPEMDGRWCLTYFSGYTIPEKIEINETMDTYTAHGQAAWYSFAKHGFGITHWRELPTPPVREKL